MTAQKNRLLAIRVSVALLLLGCILIGYSLLLPKGERASSVWNPEKVRVRQQAAAEMHQSMTALQADPDAEKKAAFRKKQAEFDRLEQERLDAIANAKAFAQRMRWGGIALVGVGGVLYVYGRKRAIR